MDLSKLDGLTLARGGHSNPDEGLCLLEAVAYIAGERHNDHPQCVSLVLGAYGRTLNDRLDDQRRQKLLPLAARLPGTRGDGQDIARAYLAADWFVHTLLPTWLDAAGMHTDAATVRALAPVVDPATARASRRVTSAVRISAWEVYRMKRASLSVVAAAVAAAAGGLQRAIYDSVVRTLKPTIDAMWDSAIDLFTRMIDPSGANT